MLVFLEYISQFFIKKTLYRLQTASIGKVLRMINLTTTLMLTVVAQLTTTKNTITYHNALCLSPQHFA